MSNQIIRKGTQVRVKITSTRSSANVKDGDLGTITRTDPRTGWRFVTLKRYRKDPAYSGLEFGPFTDSELEPQR